MRIPENAKELISDYMYYLQQSTETDLDAAKALETITVVSKDDDIMFHVIGITTDPNTNGVIFDLKSNEPFAENHDGIAGSSLQYKYCTISGNEFDERFMLLSEYQHRLLNHMIAEMNTEIFKFLHPYFITTKQDWSFELSCKGAIISIKFWGYGAYKYEKLVIRIEKINKVHIQLYGNGQNESITIFDYDDTAITMDPVPYGPLTEEIMIKLCDKVEEVMRRNLK